LSRRGFSSEQISALKRVYRLLFRSGKLLEEAIAEIEQELGQVLEIQRLLDFIRSTQRGITRP
jgi:UDP-N-acetylglucosamine acyltransferase